MKELLSRLGNTPRRTAELLLISLVANILALASPVFVMLVLGRYVTYGVDATLYTLSVGMLLALIMEFAFKQLRLKLARGTNLQTEINTSIGAFGLLASCRTDALDTQTAQNQFQIQRNLEHVSSAFNASNLCAVLDVPFALLFITTLYILNPALGLVCSLFVLAVFPLRFISRLLQEKHQKSLEEANARTSVIFNNAIRSPDTVRVFDPLGWLVRSWSETTTKLSIARANMVQGQGSIEISIASLQVLLGATIIAIGSTYVVAGELNVSALIGANILAARALAPVSRFAQLTPVFARATNALVKLREISALETAEGKNIPNKSCSGLLEFRDISFTHSGMPAPLFEHLQISLPKGAVLVIKGANGTGKTSLIRLLLGLLVPDRGQIFSDGIDVRQLSPHWWRNQISYLPQEPAFFDASIKTNLQNVNPDIDDDALLAIIEDAGLKRYIEENMHGMEMPITAGGATLALGIRKRLALARALVRKSPIIILDEPTEGLDIEGRERIYNAMNRFSRERRTTIVISEDTDMTRRASHILDLDQKPVPALVQTGLSAPRSGAPVK